MHLANGADDSTLAEHRALRAAEIEKTVIKSEETLRTTRLPFSANHGMASMAPFPELAIQTALSLVDHLHENSEHSYFTPAKSHPQLGESN